MMHKYVSVCPIMDISFQYRRISYSNLYYLGENKLVYLLSVEMSGFSIKHVRDPRSQDPAYKKVCCAA